MEKLKQPRPTRKTKKPPSKRPKTQKNVEGDKSEKEPEANEGTSPNLKTNMTPQVIHVVVSNLREDQKIAIREIRFESFLSQQMTKLPKQLTVKQFNATINIKEEDVSLVLGIIVIKIYTPTYSNSVCLLHKISTTKL